MNLVPLSASTVSMTAQLSWYLHVYVDIHKLVNTLTINLFEMATMHWLTLEMKLNDTEIC